MKNLTFKYQKEAKFMSSVIILIWCESIFKTLYYGEDNTNSSIIVGGNLWQNARYIEMYSKMAHHHTRSQ